METCRCKRRGILAVAETMMIITMRIALPVAGAMVRRGVYHLRILFLGAVCFNYAAQAQVSGKPPVVTFDRGLLTVVAERSTLGEILNVLRSRTGAAIEYPGAASNRSVSVRIGPASFTRVLTELARESRFGYVIIGLDQEPSSIRAIILEVESAPEASSVRTAQALQQTVIAPVGPLGNSPPPADADDFQRPIIGSQDWSMPTAIQPKPPRPSRENPRIVVPPKD
jgi:hypothetical protein